MVEFGTSENFAEIRDLKLEDAELRKLNKIRGSIKQGLSGRPSGSSSSYLSLGSIPRPLQRIQRPISQTHRAGTLPLQLGHFPVPPHTEHLGAAIVDSFVVDELLALAIPIPANSPWLLGHLWISSGTSHI